MSLHIRNNLLIVIIFLAIILLAYLIYAAGRHYYPVTTAEGWDIEVFQDNIPRITSIAIGKNSDYYFTKIPKKGYGEIVHINKEGEIVHILPGLDKPNGLSPYQDGIIFSQENMNNNLCLVSNLKSGMYFVNANSNSQNYNTKLLVF